MSKKKRIVIIGATSAMAEHCARLWVQVQSVDLTLVGRDAGRIERVAVDLRVPGTNTNRSPLSVDRPAPAVHFDGPLVSAIAWSRSCAPLVTLLWKEDVAVEGVKQSRHEIKNGVFLTVHDLCAELQISDRTERIQGA